MQSLKPSSQLQGGRYKIIKSLGQGGFGITYLAVQCGLERKVAIKEFFMKELCVRDESTSRVTLGTEGSRDTVNRFREKFLKEARNIAKLNHPNIVRVIDVFEENGTAYYVMEYAAGGSLSEKVKQQGYLSEPVATRYILQVADALDYIHQQKMNHLDVKPANIMLNEKDESVLIDFGLSKQYDAITGNQTSTTPVGISDGYAPMEQYKPSGVGTFSPETDIYSLGATFFKLLTGVTPPSASDVNEDGVPVDALKARGISQTAIDVICKVMKGRKKDRMKDARTFIDALKIQESKPSSEASDETSTFDDESTSYDAVRVQEVEEEEPEEAEVKADKERANAESRLKANARQKPIKKQNLNKKKLRRLLNKIRRLILKKVWLWMIACIVVIVGAIIYINRMNTIDASFSNGVLTVNGVTYDMVEVQAGTFTMGATSEMQNPFDDEKPTHQVTLTEDYYIGKTEVTQALWEAVMGCNPSYDFGNNKPVEDVSWNDCIKFISKLNSATGKNFRLPTEAEWEFAARGGNKSNHYQYSGSNYLDDVAWWDKNSGVTIHDVATKQPNELGIYDMSGNVWEWCSDWHGEYSSNSQTNPMGPDSGSYRVFRGGSWSNDARGCRASGRGYDTPDFIFDNGLRLALSKSK